MHKALRAAHLAMEICIHCKKDSSSSRKKAHVIPEGLLSNEITLKQGVECDDCNESFSKIENSFIYHNRIHSQIMVLRAPGKRKRARQEMGPYKFNEQTGKINVRSRVNSISIDSDGSVKVTIPDPQEFKEPSFRRCLGLIALRYIAWKFGREVALEHRFDNLRQYVRYGSQRLKWPYGQVCYEDSEPRRDLSLELICDAPGMTVRLRSYIDDFYLDALNSNDLEQWVLRLEGKEVFYHSA